jgi:hypothetical protein
MIIGGMTPVSYSSDGKISPDTAAASITPAANDSIISLNLCEGFLNKNPISAPMAVAPPTPSAVNATIPILVSFDFLSLLL